MSPVATFLHPICLSILSLRADHEIHRFKMFVGIYLIVVYDPNTVVNDGFHDLVDLYIPKGTILNPVRPAALSTRTHLLGRVLDLLSGLIGQKDPTFMTAGGFSDSPHF